MFTGIIQSIGKVAAIRKTASGSQLAINLKALSRKVALGDSVAINGVCLTATRKTGETVLFDAVKETITHTNLGKLKRGNQVNIELAIRAGEPFGGHFVQGHVDGTGTISRKYKQGNGHIIEIKTTPQITGQMIEKGSVAIDGISLTITGIGRDKFTIAIIPHTLKHTTLAGKRIGETVNLETDMLGKWLKKLLDPKSVKSSLNPIPREILKQLL
jgi:riboflavin synthase